MIRSLITGLCKDLGIPCVGFADVTRYKEPLFEPWIPVPFHPESIFPKARTVIVIGLPVHLPVLESAPSIWYHEEYKVINALLDQYTWRIASALNDQGYSSVSIPRDGYGSIQVLQKNPVAFFSHRHAAVLAGLGTFGRNNMVLTRKWGPRVRFGTVLTTGVTESDPLVSDEICIRCNACVKSCPVHALSDDDYPDSLTDKAACTNRSAMLNQHHSSPCGICIKVCPVGDDRDLYGRNDIRLYDDPHSWEQYHRAWSHVQSYGSD